MPGPSRSTTCTWWESSTAPCGVTTSSSAGQRFRADGRAESTGHINPKYGAAPGTLFYTHSSDQYAPFSTKVVNVGVRDSTYVLDGLPKERASAPIASFSDDERAHMRAALGVHVMQMKLIAKCFNASNTNDFGYLH